MARFSCRCGITLSNSLSPNDIEMRVYSDREWDEIIKVDIIETINIPMPKNDVWRCPNCERIYVFNEDNSLKKVYKLEQ